MESWGTITIISPLLEPQMNNLSRWRALETQSNDTALGIECEIID